MSLPFIEGLEENETLSPIGPSVVWHCGQMRGEIGDPTT
jgi:hypothetical protein